MLQSTIWSIEVIFYAEINKELLISSITRSQTFKLIIDEFIDFDNFLLICRSYDSKPIFDHKSLLLWADLCVF